MVRDRGTLRVLRTDRSGSGAPDGEAADGGADEFEVDTRRIVVTVDPAHEWRQMFDEAGRLMRDHFWVEDMAGVDWAGELARYRPLVDAVGSHDDLVDLLWELQGELGTSHAYVMRRRRGRLVRAARAARRRPGTGRVQDRAGGCGGCCRRRPRRRPRAARCPARAWTSGPAT